jgi:hypothetical protein
MLHLLCYLEEVVAISGPDSTGQVTLSNTDWSAELRLLHSPTLFRPVYKVHFALRV